MTREFIELPAFTRSIRQGALSDEELAAVQMAIMKRSGRLDKVVGVPNLWKMRWQNPRRQKGARGGLRIYFADFAHWEVCVLVLLTDKGLTENLSPEQTKQLARLMTALETEVHDYAKRRLQRTG
ncbi:MAG: hypothetical protein COZ06_25660 [Armatimonadetes bacterium CG_4_10_14_3_um_filter_66_18]|nr:hypothetical protein [Armatimonadota bacterium]OIP08704.1 MAG: hypothetical protein AUJ96_05830 [Armatimonadetes bacterium CG2_30_66_41]PIU88881.1 MAG: hypothetical protein COS65_29830 [Armatimonadetes bacterium CG06_land_8_20_14_3_00_66_21]PIX37495.1 MAG: hypothetical protein COZ57_34050 [Armatimonadetes bacterium CG_4_8_14_3_um_filter_66_20]PIY42248.1 MAG: hypothetical protein COZ06_25660 [Armatimonadetes bacterium CG_4_10_14_3_um_filter_66_18]PIZ32639.1 MAG: hypothetical protein COY42_30